MACFALILVSFGLVLVAGNEPYGTVMVIMHGESTPIKLYPNDPYEGKEHWPEGLGQLTKQGMLQLYRLGREVRRQNQHLLKDLYDKRQIYVRAANTDRTLMSAQAFLSGLYSVSMANRFSPQIAWRPVPVHTRPTAIDYMLIMVQHCPRQTKMLSEFSRMQEFVNFQKENQWVRRHVEENTNTSIQDRFFAYMTHIYGVLKTEEQLGKKLPNWTKAVYPEALEAIADFSFAIPTKNQRMARLTIGPAVRQIYGDIMEMLEYRTTRRMKVYFGLDFTISNILRGMNLKKVNIPEDRSIIQFDIIKVNRNITGIQISYNGELLRVPHCGYFCLLSEFKKKYSYLMIQDRFRECMAGILEHKIVWDGVMPEVEFGVIDT